MIPLQSSPILETRQLSRHYRLALRPHAWRPRGSMLAAVDQVSIEVHRGETLGLVGESGCGKSTLARVCVGLELPSAGSLRILGRELGRPSLKELRRISRVVQLVFQDPGGSLDPRMTVAESLIEVWRLHSNDSTRPISARIAEALREVDLDPADADSYPHQLSGGQRQRVAIARALAVNPQLIILDEAVAALDASIRAGVLNLLVELQTRRGLAYLFISHDLAVVAQLAHRVAVMYRGRIVESGPTELVFRDPLHPYTQALLSAMPVPDPTRRPTRIVLPAASLSHDEASHGCPFRDRCPHPRRSEKCHGMLPQLESGTEHSAACHYQEPR